MKLNAAINAYVLEQILTDDLPDVAAGALVDGHESESLRELADSARSDSGEIRRLFCKALGELGLPMPSRQEAGLATARSIAKDVVDGRMNPYDGARTIWWELYRRIDHLEPLKPFVGLANEYEDDEKHREDYAREIVQECRRLLGE